MMGRFATHLFRAARLSRAEIAGLALGTTALSCRNAAARQAVASEAPIVFAVLCLSCRLAGRLAARWLDEDSGRDLTRVLLLGCFLLISAVSERPAYAIAYAEARPNRALSRRLEELEAFKALADAESIRRFAAERGIRRYVLHPNSRVRWPDSLLSRPVFTCQGFRVYDFRDSGRNSPDVIGNGGRVARSEYRGETAAAER